MPWISRRRYDPRYDPYYNDRRYRRGYPQSSCLRDACLLETGCCIAEGMDGNCLMLSLPLLPRLLALTTSTLRAEPGGRRGSRALLAAIRIYQREISAHRPAVCRFTPSCSEYAAQAIETRGAARGVALAARRLLRCRPGGARGADPLPAMA
jgi:putative membrane protein insertion efficiency factor